MQNFPNKKFYFCFFLSTLSLSGCQKSESAKNPARSTAPPVPVTVIEIQPKQWSDNLVALGTVKANESVTLTAKVTETVRRVNFVDGQEVDTGDVLVELTSGQQLAQLADAQATFKEAQRQYERQQDLVKQGTVSQSMFDTQIATRDSAKAKAETIRAQLADRIITAPFAGILGLRQISPGALITPGTVITTLDDVKSVKVDFSIPEISLTEMKPGLPLIARTGAFSSRTFEGKVDSLDSRVDSATRSILVRATIPNPDHLLKPGMLLTVEIAVGDRETLTIPELALVSVGTRHYVFRLDNSNIAHRTEVKLGKRRTGEVEIVEGLNKGERVVVEGTVNLRDNSKVHLVSNPNENSASPVNP